MFAFYENNNILKSVKNDWPENESGFLAPAFLLSGSG